MTQDTARTNLVDEDEKVGVYDEKIKVEKFGQEATEIENEMTSAEADQNQIQN